MPRRSGLGKGLESLIPTQAEEEPRPEIEVIEEPQLGLRQIPIALIEPNRHQPRSKFDDDALASLADSIRSLGVLQPILVRATSSGMYELIAGERRWRASRLAGLTTVPAIIKDADELQSLEQAVVENLHRENLNPLEEAAAYVQLADDFDMTQTEIAERVGKDRSQISNYIRLLNLPPSIQKLVRNNELPRGHATTLLQSQDVSYQEMLARRVIDEGLSVRALERMMKERVKLEGSGGKGRPSNDSRRPAGVLELEQLLANHLDTRVHVAMKKSKGKIEIEFADLEDLDRIFKVINA